jgi:hypothetical protein
MSPFDAYMQLITPVAVILAIASGVAMGFVVHRMRPNVDVRLTVYLTLVLGLLWYLPQAVSLFADGGTPWATLGRWTVYTLGFVVPMWLTLRWRNR